MSDPTIRTTRVLRPLWNAACAAVGGEPEAVTLADWAALTDAGIATGPDRIDEVWAELIGAYLDAPVVCNSAASYGGLLYEATLAIDAGPAAVCVLQRFETAAQPDGTSAPVARDELLEVAVGVGDPWELLRRVLPPVETLRAPARQTAAANAHPVTLPAGARDAVSAALAAQPTADPVRLVRDNAVGLVAELLAAQAQVGLRFAGSNGDRAVVGASWYLASAEHLFRATFAGDPAWEEVRPGDLAFSFAVQLAGARDVLTRG